MRRWSETIILCKPTPFYRGRRKLDQKIHSALVGTTLAKTPLWTRSTFGVKDRPCGDCQEAEEFCLLFGRICFLCEKCAKRNGCPGDLLALFEVGAMT